MKKKTIAHAVAVVVGGFAAAGASASGFQLLEQNASGLGNAYAGSAAVAEDASTIYFNPAGMTKLQNYELSVGFNGISPSYKFQNGNSNTGLLTSTGNGGDAGSLAWLPNGYASARLVDNLYFGLGLGAPFGLKTEYDEPWIGGAQSQMFEIKTYNVNPSLAYKINDKVSVGVGLNWQKIDVDYQRIAGVGPTPIAPGVTVPLQSFTAKLKADDTAWGWNVGALFDVSPTTRVGVSYRSQIKYTIEGNLSVSGPSAAVASSLSSGARADVKLPDTFIVSVTQRLDDRWTMMGDLSYTGWSSIPKVDIVRTSGAQSGTVAQTLDTNFRDTWRVALGATYKYDDAWSFKYGVAYDQSPVKNAESRLTSLPDNDRVWLSVGAQYRFAKASRVDLGLSYLFIRDANIHNDQSAQGRGVVDGSYSGNVLVFGAQYSQAF
ncbi:OmpP1/FadL family transporter [Uliginosibacterium sp. sgz301328]|uniref:OmpP1/FadL family transporter n=1 Tax=Uliginosibacterium sp. sgz301328 TaxID=3243764 RepID=UPI00359E73F3